MATHAGHEPRPLRVFFIPFFATGHMIPMVDIARLFAARGVDATVLVTPSNAALISRTIDDAAASGLPIRTLLYPFPSAEVGLPPGAENIASVPLADAPKVDAASLLTAGDHDRLLRLHHPDAVVSDTHFAWTTSIARDLRIPRITFHAIGLFPVCVLGSLIRNLPHLSVTDDVHPFIVPDLPHPVQMFRPELPDFLRSENTAIAQAMSALNEAEAGSLGVVVNSFAEIESAYADCYYKFDNMRTWFVGPVALADGGEKASRGAAADAKAVANRELCMRWLDKQRERSVVYACFGSWCHFSAAQLRELALGLEAAGHPFLWVVRDDGEEWMPEGFEEKLGEKGLVVRGWAPQVAVLGHDAVGGFVTHCGWNSVLEGVSSGLPMVTWPLSTEQFINEKLVVEVLGTAVRAWEGFRSTEEGEKEVVKAGDVAAAVEKVMGGGEEGEKRRVTAREFGEKAKAAVKVGGSSYEGLSRLIGEIRDWPKKINGCDAATA
ncbi:hypothetical protein J5N97_004319 [Dioscorea zingiberensis]|uniref:Glycosyltransferase n=1 Tax=Dioscorea zingiberensis TaxID=325984 RepID=A0A9D5D6F1_9LILI|nr:hypothetical protein J5N97_004319 [Dioscorea zingiberensis]